MRVAIFTDNDFDKVNGVTTTLRAVLRSSPPWIQPRIYTAADVGVDTEEYFAAASLGVGLPWYREMRVYWPRVGALARALRADGSAVVHVTTPGPVGLVGRWLAHRLGLPLVGSYHTNLGEYAEKLSGSRRLGHALDAYMRWLYKPCDPLLVPSEATKRQLVRAGYDASRVRIWARGVDASSFSPARRSAALRDRWHVDGRRPAVLYAGRVSKEKGLDLVAPIEQTLQRRGLAHRFVCVGDGPLGPELEARCSDGLFLGSLPHDQVGAAMASADVFLFPSATDTLGNVVLEAQASGLPVIVSDIGGPAEQVLDGETGFICRAGDAGSFAERLELLLRDGARRAAMGQAARKHALSRSWQQAMEPLHRAWHRAAQRAVRKPDTLPMAGEHPSGIAEVGR